MANFVGVWARKEKNSCIYGTQSTLLILFKEENRKWEKKLGKVSEENCEHNSPKSKL